MDYDIYMHETALYITGGSIVGMLSLWMWYLKVKKHLKEELVDPEINAINEALVSMKNDIDSLKDTDKRLSDRVEQQFDAVKDSLSFTNQSIAKMQGSLDLIIKQLIK